MKNRRLSEVEVACFLHRIHVKKAAPSLDFLNAIISGVLTYIPFQNITLINANKPPSAQIIIEDMLSGVGGLCNVRHGFLFIFLSTLGFKVDFLSATIHQPDCHIVLLLEIEKDQFVVDVGNGFPYFQAMKLGDERVYSHPFLRYKIIQQAGHFCLQHQQKSAPWKTNYAFDLTPKAFSNFDTALDKHYGDPTWGHFLNHLRVNGWTEKGGTILRDRRLVKFEQNNSKEDNRLKLFADFEKVIAQEWPAITPNTINTKNIKQVWNNC